MLPRSLQPAMVKLRRLLIEEGARLSHHDAAAKLHVDARNAREYLKILHGQHLIRICDYRRDSQHGLPTPVYEAGSDPDEIAPARLTPNDIRRRVRAKPELWEAELKAARIRRKRKQFLAEPLKLDPLMAAVNRDASISRP